MSVHDSVRISSATAESLRLPNPQTGGGLADVFRIALPLICTSSAHAIKLFSDRAMVGWYSDAMLSASFMAGLLAAVFIVAVIATGQYTGTFVAQYMGARRFDRVGSAVWQGVLFSFAAGVVLSVLGFVGEPLLDFAEPENGIIAAGMKSYFLVMLTTAGFSIGAAAVASFWTGRGKPWMVTGVTLASMVLNVVFNWVFIFGSEGCARMEGWPVFRHIGRALNGLGAWMGTTLAPFASSDWGGWADSWLSPLGWALHEMVLVWDGEPLGVFGAALATGLTEAMTFVIFLALFLRKPNRRLFGTWPKRKFDWDLMKRLIRFGMPAGAQPFVDILTFFCFNFLIALYGEEARHAAAIAFSVNTLAFNPMMGMGAAATVLVGQSVGGRHIELARRVVRSTRKMLVVYVMAMAAVFLFAPDKIISFFESRNDGPATTATHDAEVDLASVVDTAPDTPSVSPTEASTETTRPNAMARRFLTFIAFWLVGDAFFILYSSAIRGAGDTHFAMKMIVGMSIFLYALPCVLVHVLNQRFGWGWGPEALWCVMVGYVVISGLLFYWRYRHGAWESMRVIEG